MFMPTVVTGFELQITLWLWFTVLFANFAEAMAEGRGKAQADTLRKAKTETTAKLIKKDGSTEVIGASRASRWRCCLCRSRRIYSRRRRGDRGRRVGRRIGDHGRIGSRHSRIGRRPFGGDRRHEGAVRLDQGEDHVESGRDIYRPNDRTGRRCVAAKDAERDRSEYPARGSDDHLSARGRDAAAVCDLFGRRDRRSSC